MTVFFHRPYIYVSSVRIVASRSEIKNSADYTGSVTQSISLLFLRIKYSTKKWGKRFAAIFPSTCFFSSLPRFECHSANISPTGFYSFPRFACYSANPLLHLFRDTIQPTALSPFHGTHKGKQPNSSSR